MEVTSEQPEKKAAVRPMAKDCSRFLAFIASSAAASYDQGSMAATIAHDFSIRKLWIHCNQFLALNRRLKESRMVQNSLRRCASRSAARPTKSIPNNKGAKLSAKKFRQRFFCDRFTLPPNPILRTDATG
jgi:hypothetical protein